jgi:putative endonuclease
MAEHNKVGIRGEQLACQWLEDHGFTVLHRNWRHGRDELDVVARDGGQLVVVEVKTRSSDRHGDPEEAVTLAKQRKLYRAAQAYLETFAADLDLRFDILGVTFMPGGRCEFFHIREAFYPTIEDEAIEE